MPYMFYGWDPTIIILIPAILFTLYAQAKVSRDTKRYLQVRNKRGTTGVEVARRFLDQNNLSHIPIERVKGSLTDHYDPKNQVLRLSEPIYGGDSITAVSVAAHEVGHAIQHANGYVPLNIRNAIFPVARLGSSAAWLFILGGLFIPSLPILFDIGIILFSVAVAFQIITLPVEFDASKRGLLMLSEQGLLYEDEMPGAKRVLRAAALTYVAAMASAVLQLIRLLVLRDRRR